MTTLEQVACRMKEKEEEIVITKIKSGDFTLNNRIEAIFCREIKNFYSIDKKRVTDKIIRRLKWESPAESTIINRTLNFINSFLVLRDKNFIKEEFKYIFTEREMRKEVNKRIIERIIEIIVNKFKSGDLKWMTDKKELIENIENTLLKEGFEVEINLIKDKVYTFFDTLNILKKRNF